MDLQSQYFTKADEAYRKKEYKLCLILLRKVSLNEYRSVSLLVNCSYDYWKETVVALADSKAVSRATSRPGSAVSRSSNPQGITQLMSMKDRTSPEFETVMGAIKESFTNLLANVKVVPIKQYDYIRLTHVYLAEGSLEGALQILQLASARGFLEDPLIILQSWSIMKRISSEKDTIGAMTFLASTLVIEASQRKRNTHSRQGGRTHKTDRLNATNKSAALNSTASSTIKSAKSFATLALSTSPIYTPLPEPDATRKEVFVSESDFPSDYLYLLCAAFVHREALKYKQVPKEYRKYLGELAAILSEAYFLAVGVINEDAHSLNAWFNNPLLWRRMAEKLDVHTPYVLLTQECYWEAFVRSPLEEYHIVAHVSSLIRNKTKGEVPVVLARAMEVNPWNLFVRNALYELDCELVADPAQRQWAELFLQDDHCAVRVQCTVRGWRLRRHWEEIYQRAFLRKKFYSDRKARALEKGFMIWQEHLRVCIRDWRVYVEDWKQLKYVSATLIQAHARGRMWRVWYAWTKQRIAQANKLYFVVYSKMRDKRRIDRFQHWHAMHMQLVRRRSADLLTQVFFMNGYSRLLRNGMDFILTVMRVKKKHTFKQILKYWNEKMHDRRARRARTTIRFFIRGIYQKKQQAEKEKQLAEVMQAMVEKTQGPDFRKNNLPLLRAKWDHWFALYKRIVTAQTIEKLSFMLARTFFKIRGRAIRRALRARVEGQRAFVRSTWYHKVHRIFAPWRVNAGAMKIQRAVRVRQARKVYKRLLKIADGVEEMIQKKKEIIYAQTMKRWLKHNFLHRRERIRAARWVVKLFRLIVIRGTIRRKCASKVAMGNQIDALHRCHLHMSLRRLKAATIYAARYVIMSKMVNSLRKGSLRAGFYLWAKLHSCQKAADRLLYFRAVRPLEKAFWVGAGMSVAFSALEVPSMEGTSGEWVHKRDDETLTDPFYLTNNESTKDSGGSTDFMSRSRKLRSANLIDQLAAMLKTCEPRETRYKTFETVVPARPVVLYDLQSLSTARAFKAWTACFRLRQRCLRGISGTLSDLLVQDVTCTALTRSRAAFFIQNLYRAYSARLYYRTLVVKRRREGEAATALTSKVHSRLLRRTWVAMAAIRSHLAAAARTIQCMARVRRARRRCKLIGVQRDGLQGRAGSVRAAYEKKMYALYMHQFQLNYCRAVHNTLISSQNADFFRSQKGLLQSLRQSRSMFKTGPFADSGGNELIRESRTAHSGPRSSLHREASQSTNSLSHVPAELPDVFERLTRMNKALANPNKRGKNYDGKQSFVSEECRQHLLRLHQTGVFIFDSSNTPATIQIDPKMSTFKKMMALQAEEQLHPQLTNEELEFCLQNAHAVFCQHTRKAALRCVLSNFTGVKLVLRGGELAANTVASMLFHYLRKYKGDQFGHTTSVVPNQSVSDTVESDDLLILHFVAVNTGVSARLALVRSIIDVKPTGTEKDVSRVCELAVDTDTFGRLGVAVLLRALQYNVHLRTLSVQCSGDTREGEGYLACFGESLLLLSENKIIQELKFFGAVLTLPVLESLLLAVQAGFTGLRLLEFPVDYSSGFVATTFTNPPTSAVTSSAPNGPPIATSRASTAATAPKHGKMFGKGYANQPTQPTTCVSLAESIVEAAKARAFAGRAGLAVTVNYR